jgi:hypothetical protein
MKKKEEKRRKKKKTEEKRRIVFTNPQSPIPTPQSPIIN